MKRLSILLTILLFCALCYGVIDKSSLPQDPREMRQQRRADRQAAMEHKIDSLVEARAFQFNPQTMIVEPTGRMILLSNPNLELYIVDGMADIFLPIVRGIAPPYRHSILNATISLPSDYRSFKSEEGWHVTFSSTLYTTTTYTFDMVINSKFGTITLNLENPWYNTIQYSGTITQVY